MNANLVVINDELLLEIGSGSTNTKSVCCVGHFNCSSDHPNEYCRLQIDGQGEMAKR